MYKRQFESISGAHANYSAEAELAYIRTAFSRSWKLQKADFEAIKYLMIQIASVGLTLNPTRQLAFIQEQSVNLTKDNNNKPDEWVQRPTLNIMYRGLIEILTSSGAANWVRADIVRENDEFTYNGPYEKPCVVVPNAFATRERGNIVGVYAVAQLPDGVTHFCEIIDMADLTSIKNAGNGGGAWSSFESEMQKKAPIKRIFKTIPKNPTNQARIDRAYDVSNISDGYDFSGKNKDSQKEATALPDYPQERLEEVWPKWIDRVKSGKTAAASIVTQLIGSYSLTEAQMQKVMTLSQYEPIEGEVEEMPVAQEA